MIKSEWTVHPNRSEPGDDEPGRNGHFRSISQPPAPSPAESAKKCLARIELPAALAHHGSPDGSITFGGYDWYFVVGVAHTFARLHTEVEVPPPFGYEHKGKWWWWDGTITDESVLEGPDAEAYVHEFLERLFPDMDFVLTDGR